VSLGERAYEEEGGVEEEGEVREDGVEEHG
jgi:hypothetical protein